MNDLMRAVRHGAKTLARTPQFALAAVLTLGLSIGTNAGIFSIVQGVLLEPLRYEASEVAVLPPIHPPQPWSTRL